ncbi:hypothetical protein ANANG_G00302910 [Anguilla anguilla]|uniref:Uncharacterized protein n=1 Tax=Anguilla anguilla TaxID=7936 RepID=A0A9D3RIG8_ANGAN|nr:hypothetical protein ANANG_G00302910 [Anguilla anguilla]
MNRHSDRARSLGWPKITTLLLRLNRHLLRTEEHHEEMTVDETGGPSATHQCINSIRKRG